MNGSRRTGAQAGDDPHVDARGGRSRGLVYAVTALELRDLVEYCPESGAFTFKVRPRKYFSNDGSCAAWNKRFPGTSALASESHGGYRFGYLCGVKIYAHKAAWAMAFGAWPGCQVDHIDRDASNNRIANLRLAEAAQNAMNRGAYGSVPLIGVWKEREGFRAQVTVNKKRVWSRRFETAEIAARARDAVAIQYHGEFAALNFPEGCK